MGNMRKLLFAAVVVAGMIASVATVRPVHAAATGAFSLQVSPSPLVTLVKPGQTTVVEMKVRNNGPEAEDLKIAPRAFNIDGNSEHLELVEDQVPDIAKWISFSAAQFTVQPGQTYTQKVTFKVPAEAGFSYALALVITRANQQPNAPGRNINAQLAVFSLINVDRPGAVRALEVTKFAPKQGTYEYLPAEFEIEFKNTGNTIVQPSGTVFIQRGSKDATPIDTLKVNEGGGYILPGTSRTFTAKWENGFQVITQKPQVDGTTKPELTWNWNKLGDLRIGSYTAKLIAIYDDGQRDVPLEREVNFWVIPWLMILGILGIVALIGAGIFSLVRGTLRMGQKFGGHKPRRFH